MTLPDGGVLALDLNGAGLSRDSAVGWAYGPMEWRQPHSGHWFLPQLGFRGDRYVAFVNILNDALDEWKPSAVCIENPLSVFIPASDEMTRRQVYALVGFVEEACARVPCPFSGEHVNAIRSNVAGRVWRKPQDPKAEVLAFVRREFKLDIFDHNEADAIMVWHDRRQKILGVPSAKHPLFRWDLS